MVEQDVGALRPGWRGGNEQAEPSAPAEGAVGAEDALLNIGEFSRRSRLSLKALRLYDRQGLLTPAYVDDTNGYRRYRVSQIGTARLIAMLRRLDMPLAEVAGVLATSGDEAAARVTSYWEGVERRVASQRELAAHLRTRLAGGSGLLDLYGECQLRDVPEQLVVTERRHVRVDELATWLGVSIGRLVTVAGEYGGVAGPVFVEYLGEVNQDSDGPVEVCVPIAPAVVPNLIDVNAAVANPDESDPPGGAGPAGRSGAPIVRRDPAHREAYVSLRKAQVEYPQILSAYDAAARWIATRELSISGPPREVYVGDFHNAAPDDEVCTVAFPVT